MTLTDLLGLVREKRQEIRDLRDRADALEAELQQVALAASGESPVTEPPAQPFSLSRPKPKGAIQPESSTGWALKVLQAAGRPLTVDEIMAEIGQLDGPHVAKATLVSNLSRYVQRGDTFVRTASNTYGLVDYNA